MPTFQLNHTSVGYRWQRYFKPFS